jgi:hypothetical protein
MRKGRVGIIVFEFLSLVTIPLLTAAEPITAWTAPRSVDVPATRSAPPTLGAQDKEFLAEALRLKQALGEEVWPALGKATTPLILTNDAYDFLVGAASAPASPPWIKVDGDDFSGEPYYRRESANPGAPAVEIGQGWVARLDTFGRAAATSRPEITPDLYTALLLEAYFRSFQAAGAPARFRTDMALLGQESGEPIGNPTFARDLTSEGSSLAAALEAKERADVIAHVRTFLDLRQKRRALASFSAAVAYYENEIEWLLGLGKYAAIRFYELAAGGRSSESAFARDNPRLPDWSKDFGALGKNLGTLKMPEPFVLTGMAEARILDRLSTSWKANFFREGGAIENRLRALAEGR